MNSNENQSVSIRQMKLEDIEAVYQIENQSFTLPWSKRSYQFEITENHSSRPWVAEAYLKIGSKQIVGLIVIWLILDEAHIANFAVHPSFRGLGIGRKLLAFTILKAFEEGAHQFFLEVRRGNLTAQRIYTDFGFQIEGVREKYYQDNGEDALLMGMRTINQPLLTKYAGTWITASMLYNFQAQEEENGS
jgi:[ribosomal protein S18]-alanine N-acetyltransferase